MASCLEAAQSVMAAHTGVLSPTRKEKRYSDRSFWCSYILFIVI